MNSDKDTCICVIDDDHNMLNLVQTILQEAEFRVVTADNGIDGVNTVVKNKPDLILLDIKMPGMDGYDVCYRLQQDAYTAYIPVIFFSSLKSEQDKARAFTLGAVGFLTKPIQKEVLLENIQYHLKRTKTWKRAARAVSNQNVSFSSADFIAFKDFVIDRLHLTPEQQYEFEAITCTDLYDSAANISIDADRLAHFVAEFLKLSYVSAIDPVNVELGTLPIPFCKSNFVVAVKNGQGERAYVLCNPFDLDIIDYLGKIDVQGRTLNLKITAPGVIQSLFAGDKVLSQAQTSEDQKPAAVSGGVDFNREDQQAPTQFDFEDLTSNDRANSILCKAVESRASDIHIEIKKMSVTVRFRIDGDMREMFTLSRHAGSTLVGRFKAIGGMDIAERRRPQDGTLEAVINGKNYKLRLATTSTPEGENIVIRMLEPYAKPRKLSDLGMTDVQGRVLLDVMERTHGLVLVVGPTGSGKTTTVYSLLSHLDCETRNLVTIEDPVEYRMPFANQQQVNEKAGITFETLLKSVVRLDPDVIFLGEIRDNCSARMAMDFASTGHLTVTTLHTTNTTTAVFRLERLGVDRGVMADAVLCIIAQRLVKKLCPHCKEIVPIPDDEREVLAYFSNDIPKKVAHPVGCRECLNTGYKGREGLYEILEFDTKVSSMVRSGKPIAEIRNFFRDNGVYLIGNHALEKVRDHVFSPHDVYRMVLAEDIEMFKRKGV
jgi:type II secretory ATPase GspE/PulE/Tfp pilus assembly ATPase PilB-like protein